MSKKSSTFARFLETRIYRMKKIISVVCLLFLLTGSLSARPQRREVIIDTLCMASIETLCQVVDSFCYQFQACPDSLFLWAYLGMEEGDVNTPKTKESKDAIQLRYKDRSYDPVSKAGDVAIDIYVLGTRWWKDQHLGTEYSQTTPIHARYPLTTHMTASYSGSLLDGGDVIFRMEPLDAKRTIVHYEFSIGFGRFLSAFISDNVWKNAIEWRFEVILENLVECAETGTVTLKERGPKTKK